MKKLLTTMAAMVIAGGAHAATINFESNAAGDVITGFSAGGVTGSVSATGGSNQAMVFDSNNYSGGDIDLAAPFYDSFTGRKRNAKPAAGAAKLKPGNILIISEDGNSANPDDNGSGGTITFMFDQLIDFMGFDVFDDVKNFTVTADTGQSLGGINLAYDNQFRSFSNLGWTGVSSLTCLLYTSPSPRDRTRSRMPSSA